MLIVILFNIPFAAKFQKLNLAKTDFSCAPHTIQERTSRHFEKPDAWNMWRQSIRCERPAFSVCSGDQMSLRRIVPKRLIQYEFSRDSIHSFCFSLSLSVPPCYTFFKFFHCFSFLPLGRSRYMCAKQWSFEGEPDRSRQRMEISCSIFSRRQYSYHWRNSRRRDTGKIVDKFLTRYMGAQPFRRPIENYWQTRAPRSKSEKSSNIWTGVALLFLVLVKCPLY